ncbi:Signal transduction histidine kinase [Micromonospora matsumotoense]|uniref:histidine kinase n=1 Tax=Micromonospora matsumotoense TaxID=121616 RepID=A0A1C5ARF5_9ACTN|nr:sensor histidine kinase [Micromonospora matsumotoense]SCF47835.1 Signal transduction histidine kinase [Micromonospora matsumotoense]
MGPVDILLAVVSAGVITVATAVAAEPSSESSTAAACSLGIVMGVLLLVRRERPVLVLVLSLIAVMGYNLTDFSGVSPIWPLLVPLYTVARCGQPLIGAAVGTSTLLVSTGWVLHAGAPPLELLDGALREAAMLALALVAGTAVRTQELLTHEFAARLAAERGQQERESARRLLAERLRIARELHDVTAHTIAVVGIQMNLARELVVDDPDAARAMLDTTRQINADAIGELEAAVRLLREPDAPTDPDRHPLPDETQIEDLLGRVADAGLRVAFDSVGEARPLPPAVGLTLYRIAQESLTNVLRHANATSIAVTLRYAADDVGLEIVDDGTSTPGPIAAGHGLAGMRERAASLGGVLDVGPGPGGCRVRAWLPLRPATAEPGRPAR